MGDSASATWVPSQVNKTAGALRTAAAHWGNDSGMESSLIGHSLWTRKWVRLFHQQVWICMHQSKTFVTPGVRRGTYEGSTIEPTRPRPRSRMMKLMHLLRSHGPFCSLNVHGSRRAKVDTCLITVQSQPTVPRAIPQWTHAQWTQWTTMPCFWTTTAPERHVRPDRVKGGL